MRYVSTADGTFYWFLFSWKSIQKPVGLDSLSSACTNTQCSSLYSLIPGLKWPRNKATFLVVFTPSYSSHSLHYKVIAYTKVSWIFNKQQLKGKWYPHGPRSQSQKMDDGGWSQTNHTTFRINSIILLNLIDLDELRTTSRSLTCWHWYSTNTFTTVHW